MSKRSINFYPADVEVRSVAEQRATVPLAPASPRASRRASGPLPIGAFDRGSNKLDALLAQTSTSKQDATLFDGCFRCRTTDAIPRTVRKRGRIISAAMRWRCRRSLPCRCIAALTCSKLWAAADDGQERLVTFGKPPRGSLDHCIGVRAQSRSRSERSFNFSG